FRLEDGPHAAAAKAAEQPILTDDLWDDEPTGRDDGVAWRQSGGMNVKFTGAGRRYRDSRSRERLSAIGAECRRSAGDLQDFVTLRTHQLHRHGLCSRLPI